MRMIDAMMEAVLDAIRRAARPLLVRLRWLCAAACAGLLGLTFIALAIDRWLAEVVPPPVAALLTGGLFLLIAVLMVGVVTLVDRAEVRRRNSRKTLDEMLELLAVVAAAGGKPMGLMKSLKVPLTLAALLAGCVLGATPDVRKLLSRLLPRP